MEISLEGLHLDSHAVSVDFANDEFFKTATFFWPRDRPGYIPCVRDQVNTNSCYAFTIVNVMYADLLPVYKDQILREEATVDDGYVQDACLASVQEFINHLHIDWPPRSFDPNEPISSKGLPNNFRNAFEYVRDRGVCIENHYPFVGKYQCSDERPILNPDYKIYVENFEKIPCTDYGLVVQQLCKQPLAGSILHTYSFKKWTPANEIYEGPTEDELEDLKKKKIAAKMENKTWAPPLHALTLVGYGTKGNVHYYVCQNSYGTTWGYHGFIKVRRDLIKSIYYPCKTFIKKEGKCVSCSGGIADSSVSNPCYYLKIKV